MSRIVFLLHGIRTHAHWQRAFADVATNHGWKCPLDGWWYGRFSVFQFLTPFARRAKIAWFRARYTAAFKEHQRIIDVSSDRLPSVVAHSFGTYILGHALLKYKDIKFDKIIMCGSLLPREFPWHMLIERGQVNAVRNDVGLQDVWTKRSTWVIPGSGASGSRGFQEKCNRFFQHEHNLSHSEFFDPAWMEQHWIPFLEVALPPRTNVANDTRAIPLPRGDRPALAAVFSGAILLSYLIIAASVLAVVSRLIIHPVNSTEFALKDFLTKDPVEREFLVTYANAESNTPRDKHGFATVNIEERAQDVQIIDVTKCGGYTYFKDGPNTSGILWMRRVAVDPDRPESLPPRGTSFHEVIEPRHPLDDPEVLYIPSDEQLAAAIEGQPEQVDGESIQNCILACDNQTGHDTQRGFSVDILIFRWNTDIPKDQAPPRWHAFASPCPPRSSKPRNYSFVDKTRGYHFIYGSFCGREARYLAQGSLTTLSGRPTLTIRFDPSSGKLLGELSVRSVPVNEKGITHD